MEKRERKGESAATILRRLGVREVVGKQGEHTIRIIGPPVPRPPRKK